ncbi:MULTISPECIES: YrhB domain-containing protein [unclassified Streptomyces]|uniref:YrhB domain-containing protein n=1 Tax=unclassified Streptomyces TaxID=2593676 RepID=UPI001EFC919D|nr:MULTISPECIES: YrhB domain-containing protein [unclassified Streptomyces]
MIGRETARRLVQEELDRGTPRAVVVDVREHELVWIVSWQSEEYVRTREPEFALAGNGPYPGVSS